MYFPINSRNKNSWKHHLFWRLFLIHQMKIQIIIHYLKTARRLCLGWGPAPRRLKQQCQEQDPARKDSVTHPLGFFILSVLQKCGHFWQLNKNFNSRSTLWNGTLISPRRHFQQFTSGSSLHWYWMSALSEPKKKLEQQIPRHLLGTSTWYLSSVVTGRVFFSSSSLLW